MQLGSGCRKMNSPCQGPVFLDTPLPDRPFSWPSSPRTGTGPYQARASRHRRCLATSKVKDMFLWRRGETEEISPASRRLSEAGTPGVELVRSLNSPEIRTARRSECPARCSPNPPATQRTPAQARPAPLARGYVPLAPYGRSPRLRRIGVLPAARWPHLVAYFQRAVVRSGAKALPVSRAFWHRRASYVPQNDQRQPDKDERRGMRATALR